MGGAAALRVLAPIQRQIQFAVNQGVPTCRDVGEKDAHLAILDPPADSTLLESHPSRLGAPLGKPAFINDQDRFLRTELLQRVGTQVIAHAIGIPDRLREQTLHAIGTRFSGMFGQLPPIFAGRVTQDADAGYKSTR